MNKHINSYLEKVVSDNQTDWNRYIKLHISIGLKIGCLVDNRSDTNKRYILGRL